MKLKLIVTTLTIGAASLLTNHAFGQYNNDYNKNERDRKDSVETATVRAEEVQTAKDENTMSNAKLDRKQTKAKAKEAQRIEKDANDAARQSRYAVRSERKAQKSRKQANKQANKASKAREKSNNN